MVKDSSKPRGKTSPYGFFVKMCFDEHKKKYPNENVQVTEITKKCAEKWKTMEQNEKQRFVELAKQDAERYQREVAQFGGDSGGSRKRKAGKKEKDVNAPKRPLSAFFSFSQTKRQEIQQAHPEWKVGDVAKELGRLWKDMDPSEKKEYEDMSARDKARYEGEMRDYKAGGGGGGGKAAKKGAGASTSHPSGDDDDEEDDEDDFE
jgi:hypothetical protein